MLAANRDVRFVGTSTCTCLDCGEDFVEDPSIGRSVTALRLEDFTFELILVVSVGLDDFFLPRSDSEETVVLRVCFERSLEPELGVLDDDTLVLGVALLSCTRGLSKFLRGASGETGRRLVSVSRSRSSLPYGKSRDTKSCVVLGR